MSNEPVEVRVNTRGCQSMTPDAAKTIAEAADKLRDAFGSPFPLHWCLTCNGTGNIPTADGMRVSHLCVKCDGNGFLPAGTRAGGGAGTGGAT